MTDVAICLYLGACPDHPIQEYTLEQVNSVLKTLHYSCHNIPGVVLITNIPGIKSSDSSLVVHPNESEYVLLSPDNSFKEDGVSQQDIENIAKAKKHFYYKLEMFKLAQFKRIVYIDIDMLINKNISEVWDLNQFNDADIYGWHYEDYNHPGYGYAWQSSIMDKLNSGFLIINRGMLDEQIHKDMLNIMTNGYSPTSDEGVLHRYLNAHPNIKVGRLPMEYNVFPPYLGRNVKNEDAKCIHFSGKIKPWEITEEILAVKHIYYSILSRGGEIMY